MTGPEQEPEFIEDDFACVDSSSESDPETPEKKDEKVEKESEISVTRNKIPKIGMVFSSEEEAYNFYSAYARVTGFNVRKGQYRRLWDGTIRKRMFLCSKEGRPRSNDPVHLTKETRTGCNAKILLTVEKGVWIVSQFIPKHNHDLPSPGKIDMLRLQRHVDEAQANLSDTNSHLLEEASGSKNVGFQKSDCDSFLRDKNINTLQAGDSQSAIDHFKHMQAGDPSFFYTVQVDSENHITNFFWRDGRSKMDYDYFGDVVVFDTTYRADNYNMICAPFIGVNHHGQNVLFGCAFLQDETIESFVWLFESFLEAVGKRRPKTFCTNQCRAMADAIEKVLPETQHRIFLWHIGQNAAKYLSEYYEKSDFRSQFNRCLYDCETDHEFQLTWDQLLEAYNLLQNPWLQELYKLREKWCPAFTEGYFTAGIQLTQRSDSMHNVFCQLTSKTMSLTQFVRQYEKETEQRRQAELLEDFRCNHGASPRLAKNSGMVKQAASVYTDAIFQLFQEELCECLSVAIEEIDNDEIFYTYKLIQDGHKRESIVKFRSSDCMVECSCKKFESMGILCLHALKVLNARNIFHIPPQYILKRWTKCAKDGLVMDDHGKAVANKLKRPIGLRRSQLMHKAVHFATKSALMDETTRMAEDILVRGLGCIESVLKTKRVEDAPIGEEVEIDNEDDVSDKDDIACSSNDMPVLVPPRVRLKEVSNAGIRSQLEKKKRKKKISQVQHGCNNSGQKSASGVLTHVNILPKPPIVFSHQFLPSGSHMDLNFGLQGCISSSMPLASDFMPTSPLNQGSFPSVAVGHPNLPEARTQQACAAADVNGHVPQFSQESSQKGLDQLEPDQKN